MTEDLSEDLRAVTVVCTFYQDVDRVAEACARIAPIAARGAEVLLVDDASRDGTADALRRAAPAGPSVDVIGRTTNGGVAAARNDAVRRASREFLWFCDSDDDWAPDVLDRLLAGVTTSAIDVVVAGARIVEYRTRAEREVDVVPSGAAMVLSGAQGRHELVDGRMQGYLWNKLFRRSAVAAVEFPPLRSQSDFAFTYQVISGSRSIAWISDRVYRHLLRAGSVSQTSRGVDRNLKYCYDLVIEDLRAAGANGPATHDFFRLWFYVVPASRALMRSDAPEDEVATSLRVVTGAITPASLVHAARRSPSLAFRCLLIKIAPRLLTRIYRAQRAGAHREESSPDAA